MLSFIRGTRGSWQLKMGLRICLPTSWLPHPRFFSAMHSWACYNVDNHIVSKTRLSDPLLFPFLRRMFETFSYLPPLDDTQISKQVDYIVNNGWTPCLEFADTSLAYMSNENTIRMGNCAGTYYDNRYWTMWKLPMFGCTDASQVIKEIATVTKTFPNAYVRMAAFDAARQVQVASFLVQRPKNATDWAPVEKRSVAC